MIIMVISDYEGFQINRYNIILLRKLEDISFFFFTCEIIIRVTVLPVILTKFHICLDSSCMIVHLLLHFGIFL